MDRAEVAGSTPVESGRVEFELAVGWGVLCHNWDRRRLLAQLLSFHN